MRTSSALANSTLVWLLCVLHSTVLMRHTADSLLFPIKPPPKVLCKAIAFQKRKLQCKEQKKNKILFLNKKKKVQGAKSLLAAGAAVAATTTVIGAGVVATATAAVVLNNVEATEIYKPVANSLNGQSILITGGTTGLGLETAKRLAIGSPDNVIITARTSEKGQAAVDEIYKHLSVEGVESDTVSVSYKILDLDDVQGIQDSVSEWLQDEDSPFPDQLDCIINNAGVMNIPQLELSSDGVERQMASNHLGHFVLTRLLASKLSKCAKVINVSSNAYQFARPKGMDFDYCWTGSPNYSPWKSYGQSKLANILFSQELQRRSDEAGYEWDVACLHPGVVNTDLWRQSVGPENFQRFQDLQKNVQDNIPAFVTDSLDTLSTKIGDLGLFKTVEQGATTSVWLASGAYQDEADKDTVVRTNAQYYEDCKPKSLDSFAKSMDAAQRLWEESEERAGITFDLLRNENDENLGVDTTKAEDADEEEIGDVKEDGEADDDDSIGAAEKETEED